VICDAAYQLDPWRESDDSNGSNPSSDGGGGEEDASSSLLAQKAKKSPTSPTTMTPASAKSAAIFSGRVRGGRNDAAIALSTPSAAARQSMSRLGPELRGFAPTRWDDADVADEVLDDGRREALEKLREWIMHRSCFPRGRRYGSSLLLQRRHTAARSARRRHRQ